MNYLISGAAGFIGSHLAEVLLADGHNVVGVDNFATGSKTNVSLLENNKAYTFIEHDVTESLDKLDLPKLDRVMHFASAASPPDYQRLAIETLRAGSLGTENMLKLAQTQNARFMLASTSEVYGDPTEHPQKETYWGNVNSVGPRSMYDEAKRYAEAMSTAYQESNGVDVRIVRIFNTYGPRMRPDDGRVVSNLIVQAINNEPLTIYGDGDQTRSFCYVSDEVQGILGLFESDHKGPVNVGNPNEFTVLELANIVLETIRTESQIEHKPLPKDDPTRRRPDISMINKLCGWEPKVQLREGVRLTAIHFAELLGRDIALLDNV